MLHRFGCQAGDIEGANQVDLDHAAKRRQVVRATVAQHSLRMNHPCTDHRTPQTAEGVARFGNGRPQVGFIQNVGLDEPRPLAEFPGARTTYPTGPRGFSGPA